FFKQMPAYDIETCVEFRRVLFRSGVSGGTIAVLLGIYDRLIASINGLFSKEWKRHLGFLIPLGIGAGLALFSLSHLMEWLIDTYPVPTFYTFIGLIVGVLPFL